MATRRLELAGEQPVYQAVPEDYVLASLLFKTLDAINSRDIEFILKCYLPIHIYRRGGTDEFLLFEPLALLSENIISLPSADLTKEIDVLASNPEKPGLLHALEQVEAAVNGIVPGPAITLPGLLSAGLADGISDVLDWPEIDYEDHIAVILPSLIAEADLSRHAESIKVSYDQSRRLRTQLVELLDTLHSSVRTVVKSQEAASAGRLERLKSRISRLEDEVQRLSSRLEASKKSKSSVNASELRQQLEDRRTALKRDCSQMSSLEGELASSSEGLSDRVQAIQERVDGIMATLDDQDAKFGRMFRACSRAISDDGSTVLVPFLAVGYSSKGAVKSVFYPPSYLVHEHGSPTRKKAFVDCLMPVHQSLDAFAQLLSQRVDDDVALLKQLRASSEKVNILSLLTTRATLYDGAKLLVADGLLRESSLQDLNSLLARFPEQAAPKTKARPGKALVVDEGTLTKVRFVVTDEEGKPLADSRVTVGMVEVRTDSKGIAMVNLPKSRHEVVLSAEGFREKALEFSLDSTGDVAVPVVMNRLTKEEQLDSALEVLIQRAERIDEIRDKLRLVFEKQGEVILSVPAYRSALVQLLSDLGYDAEAWIANAREKRGMLGRLLKRDDRYDGLRRDILRFAEEAKSKGGLMLFSELLYRLDGSGWRTNPDEVEKVLDSMTKEGLVQGLTTADDGTRVVNFVPVALTGDPGAVLGLAAKMDGRLTIETVVVELRWSESRARNALDLLAESGVAKVQKSFSKSTVYWFPGLRERK